MSFENWERGTRNVSGAKVRTYASDLPKLRMSTPRQWLCAVSVRKGLRRKERRRNPHGGKGNISKDSGMVAQERLCRSPRGNRSQTAGKRSRGIVRSDHVPRKQTCRPQPPARNKRPARLLCRGKPPRNANGNKDVQPCLRNREGLRRKRRNACNRSDFD